MSRAPGARTSARRPGRWVAAVAVLVWSAGCTIGGEPDPVVHVDESDFSPVLCLGSHRLAFVGEAITLDASRSWVRGGGAAPDGDWDVLGDTLSGPGPYDVTFDTPGLYEITYTVGGVRLKVF